MNKFLPPKPSFVRSPGMEKIYPSDSLLYVSKNDFDLWYDKEIVPLFEHATEVWLDAETGTKWSEYVKDTYKKALLINIEPIKEDGPEDILREIVENDDYEYGGKMGKALDKARKYLGSKK